MKTQHTPTPWALAEMHKHGVYLNDGSSAIVAGGGRVALVDCRTKYPKGFGCQAECATRNANAAFILTACNLHDDLVRFVGRWGINAVLDADHPMVKEARELLEKARKA